MDNNLCLTFKLVVFSGGESGVDLLLLFIKVVF